MHRYLIGIDVGGTNIKMMIMDEGYGVIAETSVPTMAELGYEAISDRMLLELDGMFVERGIETPAVAMETTVSFHDVTREFHTQLFCMSVQNPIMQYLYGHMSHSLSGDMNGCKQRLRHLGFIRVINSND